MITEFENFLAGAGIEKEAAREVMGNLVIFPCKRVPPKSSTEAAALDLDTIEDMEHFEQSDAMPKEEAETMGIIGSLAPEDQRGSLLSLMSPAGRSQSRPRSPTPAHSAASTPGEVCCELPDEATMEDLLTKAATRAAFQADIVMDDDLKDEETLPILEDETDIDPFPDVRDFVICTSKQGKIRRLHRVGGCWRIPGVDHHNWTASKEIPALDTFDTVCKQCWPATTASAIDADMPAGQVDVSIVPDDPSATSSSGSSSTSSESRDKA